MAELSPHGADLVPHIPVLLEPILTAISPVTGVWLDGTFGNGGYTRALLDAGALRVLAVDRDPYVFEQAGDWTLQYADRLTMIEGEFGRMDRLATAAGVPLLDGVVLDIGVSSMQIDQAARGFSFMHDGPLDMRMARSGRTAADIVNGADESTLADIIYNYGEERASRRIARNIIRARAEVPILTTGQLTTIIEASLPRPRPGQLHPATRTFQALRIAVNDELGQLAAGLMAAEAALRPGGWLAVVSFHSLEDRIVKRFLQQRSGDQPNTSRYLPEAAHEPPRFERISRKAIVASDEEVAGNPRSRSAKLRLARRLDAPAGRVDPAALGLPEFDTGRIA
jgi:16S rRNA (cytosine1402-N4)-methyltransferase